jgi:hypothetical protein
LAHYHKVRKINTYLEPFIVVVLAMAGTAEKLQFFEIFSGF